MNLYGIENRKTIGDAIKIADGKTTLNDMFSLNLKYVTCADVRGYMNVNQPFTHIMADMERFCENNPLLL